jgi:transcriptional regulator with XRE-family HTH domain
MDYENSTKIFQRNVLNLLRAKGITQAKFARQLGVDESTINRILKGSRGTSLDWLDKTSRVLGVSTTYLINPCAGLKIRFRENIVETFIRG